MLDRLLQVAVLAEARRRIIVDPTKYVNHIYGEREVGGTSMLYLSGVPFAKLGFPALGTAPVSAYTEAVMRQTPTIALTVAAGASALYWIIKRRQMNMVLAQPLAAPPTAGQSEEKSKEVEP